MICSKCMSEMSQGCVFCPTCGEKSIAQNDISSTETGNGVISFTPQKIFGQYLIRKFILEINGKRYVLKNKQTIELTLPKGEYNLLCYGKSLFIKACRRNELVSVKVNENLSIFFKTRIIVFFKGKLIISNSKHENLKSNGGTC